MATVEEAHRAGFHAGRLQELRWMRDQLVQAVNTTPRYGGAMVVEALKTAVEDRIREVQP